MTAAKEDNKEKKQSLKLDLGQLWI